MSTIETAFRADMRELNESNFTRFDARLEQRFAESDAKWERRVAELGTHWERRLAELDIRWEGRFAALKTDLADLNAAVTKQLAGVKSGQKWMLVFWAPTALAVIASAAAMLSPLVRH